MENKRNVVSNSRAVTDVPPSAPSKNPMSGVEKHRKPALYDLCVSEVAAIENNLTKACNLLEQMKREIEVYDAPSSDKSVINLMMCIKAMWFKCEKLRKFADVKECNSDDFWYPERSFLMNAAEIRVVKKEDSYRIMLPILIPHKKATRSIPNYSNSYRMPLYSALRREFPDRRPVFDDKCSILIYHHFENETCLTDYDNFDYTHLINCLASFFLVDDSPKYYKLTIDGVVDGHSFTEIRLKKRKQI